MLSGDPFTRYQQLESIVELAGVAFGVSELHGMVCGQACRAAKTGVRLDFRFLLDSPETVSPPEQVLLNSIRELENEVSSDLDEGFDFSLLLPCDEEGLDFRTRSMADWARGFVTVLLGTDGVDLNELPPYSREFVEDLMDISEAEPGDDAESDEWSFAEIEEYMRVGVQLTFREISDVLRGNLDRETIH